MRIGIVGLGLIGTSIALAVRRAYPNVELIGVDRIEIIRHRRILQTYAAASSDLRAVAGAELVVLATPVEVILATLPRLAGLLPADATVLDTGSTKRQIIRAAREVNLTSFVGGHPMGGASSQGPDQARAGLFDGRPWFLVPTQADSPASAKATAFVEMLGAVPLIMTDDGAAHDRLMAAISHLPQIVASALMARVGKDVTEDDLRLAGPGLQDTTRLAESSAGMWESILATNADALRPLLIKLADDLREIAGQLEDPGAIRQLFDEANRFKRLLSSS